MENNEEKFQKAVTSAVAKIMNYADSMFPQDHAMSVSLLQTAYVMLVVKHYGTGPDIEGCLIDSVLEAYDIASGTEVKHV